MGHDRYDVIIVGAGPAGSTAAKICADNNLSVALIEKGEFPGSKNMFGGSIFRPSLEEIIPDYLETAPLERKVIREVLYFMETDSVVEMGFTSFKFAQPPYNTFTIIRSRFDRWLAGIAEKAGAHLMNSTLVEDLLYEQSGPLAGKKVVGVILEDGQKIYSDIVILAEGAMADLTRKAGLRKKNSTDLFTLYVKELIALPEEIINARFNLEKDEGMNIGMVGYPTAGAIGKGGIWVNKDTISIIVGAYLNQLIKNGLNPYQLLCRLKEHPSIKRLIEGGITVQYMSKIIPKGGYDNIPELFDDGVLVAGDAGMLVSGRHGTDAAMLSGKYAAETAVQAKARGDFSKKALSAYEGKINNSFFYQNLKINRKAADYYKKYPDTDYLISKTLNEITFEFFKEGSQTRDEKIEMILEKLKQIQPPVKTIKDFYNAALNWRFY
ncbi:MAG: FAD-binding protein [Halanaerobiales bacterium]